MAKQETPYRVYGNKYDTSCNEYTYEAAHAVTNGCIAIETDKICELIYSPYISVVISVTLVVKIITISFAAYMSRSRKCPC
ncbi:uncharacterized protein N7483_007606 [Penicillium malachiteum]|uniref:uncharacterized protein n=1 Tax=Penicillium malachiteum TaxID=1324776 RepID=UPI002548CBF8|nr:uncharacterized protein N7483_007606 [Penicillium malachiteum]KAJ5726249.1 hypothetical protein N7483_007606 [Penicillium malachiteum]